MVLTGFDRFRQVLCWLCVCALKVKTTVPPNMVFAACADWGIGGFKESATKED